ncbi:LON peptidase N-terminal domain and RING finger protein 2 [Callorhinchus milii]|uniref:LON peptidase N-terminal domain and RING finger protein 2 n=1 Tax=Callorhinchus milii TaxID=7868 RepID=UPI001C3F7F16|nr:LON peptidase N-terminal domain and RING finger protein 2 [Callorhinchus milii]
METHSEMLELAEEAFRARNYELAADIYECQLQERGPERRLYLGKARSLARSARLNEAFETYQKASELGRLLPENLQELLEAIAASIRSKDLDRQRRKKPERQPQTAGRVGGSHTPRSSDEEEEEAESDVFSCRLCLVLLYEPITVPCGHTFCKSCLEKQAAAECKLCGRPLHKGQAATPTPGETPSAAAASPGPNFRLNVVLCNLLGKWFAAESQAQRLRPEAEQLCHNRNYSAALELYNQALSLAPHDYLMLCNRAELHINMGNYKEALHDGETACTLKPLRTKSHFWKARALAALCRSEEALKEYIYCIALRPDWKSVKLEAQKILCDMFSPVLENMQDSLPSNMRRQSSYTRPKPTFLSSFSSPPAKEDTNSGTSKMNKMSMQDSDVSNQVFKRAETTLDEMTVMTEPTPSSLTAGSLKRKQSCDPETCHSLTIPSKMAKKGDFGTRTHEDFKATREVSSELIDASDLECSLCMRLFYEPVTTSCGHTFCLKCLERCLDHNSSCPLCKENLAEYLAMRAFSKTLLTEEVIVRYLPEELKERRKLYQEEIKELSNLNEDVPIFVCTMGFPTIPCPLHVFEPRYRLMIRRSMEIGTKQFGMCIGDDLKGFADYGCMLEVRNVKFFPDGRSVVDTIGKHRFKVLSHGQRDGYNTANIEYLEDKKVEGEEYNELVQLHDSVYDQALTWFNSLKDNMRTQILNHFGPMPKKEPSPQSNPDGPAWCWWLLAVLPLESRAQLAVLAMTSLKDRLIAIRRVLLFVIRRRPR